MKRDYKKIFASIYSPKPGKPDIVTAPRMNFLMVSGKGHPEDGEFGLALKKKTPPLASIPPAI
jgi:hypothetical protein